MRTLDIIAIMIAVLCPMSSTAQNSWLNKGIDTLQKATKAIEAVASTNEAQDTSRSSGRQKTYPDRTETNSESSLQAKPAVEERSSEVDKDKEDESTVEKHTIKTIGKSLSEWESELKLSPEEIKEWRREYVKNIPRIEIDDSNSGFSPYQIKQNEHREYNKHRMRIARLMNLPQKADEDHYLWCINHQNNGLIAGFTTNGFVYSCVKQAKTENHEGDIIIEPSFIPFYAFDEVVFMDGSISVGGIALSAESNMGDQLNTK